MKSLVRVAARTLVAAATLPLATAQDSVSKTGCLPGDAVIPWSAGEQVNRYVVDLSPVFSSWGTPFRLGPLAKAGQSNSQFFSNFMGSQGISRRFKEKTPFAAASFPLWTGQPGTGVNGDPSLNDAPTSFVNTSGKKGLQFAAVFGENEITVNDTEYLGIVTSVVNMDSQDASRLYVTRIQAAVNSCDDQAEYATLYAGAVDSDGNTIFRSDGFGMTTTGSCGLTAIPGNNIFLVDALARNGGMLNVVSNDFPGGLFDAPATKWILRNVADAVNTPTILPEGVGGLGGAPRLLGTNFISQFVRGADFGLTTADTSHLPAGVPDHRGNLAWLSRNFAPLGSTHGLAALIGRVANTADRLIVFGLNAASNVTGTMSLVLPAVVVDNSTGFTNIPGTNEFDHYHSQVAFQGGNGQVALQVDADGDLLVAAQVSMPFFASATNGVNYIAVCRVDATTAAKSWTMAGYNDGFNGKPVLDSPGGNPIAQMVPLGKFTAQEGPSVSAPMIDGAGNVWFISAIEMFDGSGPAIALLRAVYDRANFAYDLELVAKTGDIVPGVNSGRNYRIASLRLADSNSVGSDTAFSQNIVEDGFMGIDGTAFDPLDPRALGGLVVSATLIYDVNQDFQFEPCDPTGPAPSPDESYRVLFYVGAEGTTGILSYGQGCHGTGFITPTLSLDGYPKAGQQVSLEVAGGLAGQQAILFFGLSPAAIPVNPNCFLNVQPLLPLSFALPLLGPPGPGNGSIAFTTTVPLVLSGFQATMQAFCSDPGVPRGFSNTNGVQITFQ